MLRAGVPVTSELYEPRNAEWAAKYAPGSEPGDNIKLEWLDQWLEELYDA